MADDGAAAEDAALRAVLAAEHAVVWGYGVVGAALPAAEREAAVQAENAHRDVRDRVAALLAELDLPEVPAQAAYELPFPVLSAVDAAALAVVLEDGAAAAWVVLLDAATQPGTRVQAARELGAAEIRAVRWRTAAGQTPASTPFPGLPA